jgi:nucleoid DNA-binding protein
MVNVAQLGSLEGTVNMAEHLQKAELVRRLAQQMKTDDETAEAWVDAILETMYEVFKSGKGLSLPGFGEFAKLSGV